MITQPRSGDNAVQKEEGQKEVSKSCASCAFFVDGTKCYRYPPGLSSHGMTSRRPYVEADDVCGEWTPRSWYTDGDGSSDTVYVVTDNEGAMQYVVTLVRGSR